MIDYQTCQRLELSQLVLDGHRGAVLELRRRLAPAQFDASDPAQNPDLLGYARPEVGEDIFVDDQAYREMPAGLLRQLFEGGNVGAEEELRRRKILTTTT